MYNIIMAKEWLKASNIDIEVIEEIYNNPNLSSMTAFHSQQSIEKSLKAILEYYNLEVPKIHKISKLIKLVNKYINIDNSELIMKIDTLYIDSRYPGDMGLLPYGNPTLKDAKEFYNLALNIFNQVGELLNIKESKKIIKNNTIG